MRAIFRQALTEIIGGTSANHNEVIWDVYKRRLRPINPDDVPEKVRDKFRQIKDALEKKCQGTIDDYIYFNTRFGKPITPEDARAKVEGDSWHHRPLTNLSHPVAKMVKLNLLEIVEQLPKRTRKVKE